MSVYMYTYTHTECPPINSYMCVWKYRNKYADTQISSH